jgi:hypothetical protein
MIFFAMLAACVSSDPSDNQEAEAEKPPLDIAPSLKVIYASQMSGEIKPCG